MKIKSFLCFDLLKSVRYWRCPLGRNWDRIILNLAEAGTNMWKMPVPGGNQTHNLMDTEQMLYWLSHSGSWFTWHNVICLRTMAKMQPCGLQPIEMLRCWLVLQPHSCRLSWQAAPALDLLLEKLNIQIVCWQYVMPCLFFLTRDVVFLSPYSAQWVLNTQKFYIPSALSIATSHSSHHIKVPWAYFLENLIA